MNCIIYSRVSTVDKQDNARQIAELTEYAKYRKFKILKVFEEKITGTSKAADRAGFKKLLEFIDANKIDHILIWELSRLGRTLFNLQETIEDLSNRKINIYSKKESINTLDERGNKSVMTNMLISILGGFAEMERDTFKQRSISGIRHNVANGGSGTGVIMAYGYEKLGKKLIVNKDEAKVVKLIFEKYLSGLGTQQLAAFLNREKIPTRYNKQFATKEFTQKYGVIKKGSDYNWKDGTVYRILRNTIYIGERRHKGEVFPIESIIDRKTFEKVQDKLTSNSNKKDINRKYDNVLQNLLICGNCGRGYFMHKRANGKDNAYKCISKRYDEDCGNPSVNIDKLNNALALMCAEQIIDKKVETKGNIKEGIDGEIENKEILLKNVEHEIASIGKQTKKLLKHSLEDMISDKDFKTANTELKTNLLKQQDLAVKLNNDIAKLKNLRDLKKDKKKLRKLLDYTPEMFKEFAPQIFDYVKVYDVKSKEAKKRFPKKHDLPILIQYKTLLSDKLNHFVIGRWSKDIKLLDFENELDDKVISIKKGRYSLQEHPLIEIPDIL